MWIRRVIRRWPTRPATPTPSPGPAFWCSIPTTGTTHLSDEGPNPFRVGYAVDVLNLIALLPTLPQARADAVGLFGPLHGRRDRPSRPGGEPEGPGRGALRLHERPTSAKTSSASSSGQGERDGARS
jgi:hypothetical protein